MYVIDVNTLAIRFLDKETQVTPLIAACVAGHGKIIKYLISKAAKVNKPSMDGSTPLHHALSLETIKYLQECGADINKVCNEGISPLLQVIRNVILTKETKIQILRYLLEKNANAYQRTTDGYTQLYTLLVILHLLIKK